MKNAYAPHNSISSSRACNIGHTSHVLRAVRSLDHCRSTRAVCVFATYLPSRGLSLDARLLGLRSGRIFLGARDMGRATRSWPALDSGLLGLGRWRVCLE